MIDWIWLQRRLWEERGIWVKTRDVKEITKLAGLSYRLLQQHGYYLIDAPFCRLSHEEKKRFLDEVYGVWITQLPEERFVTMSISGK